MFAHSRACQCSRPEVFLTPTYKHSNIISLPKNCTLHARKLSLLIMSVLSSLSADIFTHARSTRGTHIHWKVAALTSDAVCSSCSGLELRVQGQSGRIL